MSQRQNYARVFASRSSGNSFIADNPDGTPRLVVALICTVIEPIRVSDSILGDDSFSLQFQSNTDAKTWMQGTFQFSPKLLSSPIFQVYEADINHQGTSPVQVALYDSVQTQNPLPKINGLDVGYSYSFQELDDGSNLYFFASIQNPSGNILWQSPPTKFKEYGHPIDANGVACGSGGSSYASFSAGRLRFQILSSPAYADLISIQPNPWLTIPYQTPAGPILFQTDETENMKYNVVGPYGGVGIGYEEALTFT